MIPKQKKHENIRNSGIFAELVKEFYFAGKVKLFFSLFIIFAIVSLSTNKTNIFRLWSREKKKIQITCVTCVIVLGFKVKKYTPRRNKY